MTGFLTSTDTMRGTAARVLTDAESVQSDLQALLTRLQALEGQWSGDGRLAFQSAEDRYRIATTTLHRALSTIGELITRNEARYSSDDSQAGSRLAASGAHFAAPGF